MSSAPELLVNLLHQHWPELFHPQEAKMITLTEQEAEEARAARAAYRMDAAIDHLDTSINDMINANQAGNWPPLRTPEGDAEQERDRETMHEGLNLIGRELRALAEWHAQEPVAARLLQRAEQVIESLHETAFIIATAAGLMEEANLESRRKAELEEQVGALR